MADYSGYSFLVLGLEEQEVYKPLGSWGSELVNVIHRDFPGSHAEFFTITNDEDILQKTFIFYSDVLQYDFILVNTDWKLSQTTTIICETIGKSRNVEANGFVTSLYMECLKVSPAAVFSRLACGFRNKTLLSTFPDVSSNIEECFKIMKPILIDIIKRKDDNPYQNIDNGSYVSKRDSTLEKGQLERQQRKEGFAQPYYAHERHERVSNFEQSGYYSPVYSNCNVTPDEYFLPNSFDSLYPVKVEEAVAVINKLFRCCEVRSPTLISVSKSLGYVTADVIRALEPYPAFNMTKVEGYACRSDDGNNPRKLCESALKLERGQCVFLKPNCPLPRGADWVIELKDSSYNSTITEITFTDLPGRCERKNVITVGAYIKAAATVIDHHKMIGINETGTLAAVGVTQIPVFSKPYMEACFMAKDEMDEDTYAGITNSVLINTLKVNGFQCIDGGRIINDEETILASLVEKFATNNILIIQNGFQNDGNLLSSIICERFNGTIIFNRVDIVHGKNTRFLTCVYDNCMKFVFILPTNHEAILHTLHIIILPVLMFWSGVDSFQLPRINVWLTHRIYLHNKPSYKRAFINFSPMHDCPQATVHETELKSVYYPDFEDVLLELPPSNPNQQYMEANTIIQAILIK